MRLENGYPTNTEASVRISSDELLLIMALTEAVKGRRQLTDQELEDAEQLQADADQIQRHVPGETGFHYL